MTTTLKTFAAATAGAAALAVGGVDPAQAFEFTFNFEGNTGYAHTHLYPEYQNARFEGFFTVDSDAPDQNPSPTAGKFVINDFFIKIINDCFPEFQATITPTVGTTAFLKLESLATEYEDAGVGNESTYNPTRADFRLFFDDPFFSTNPNNVPTSSPDPDTFVPGVPNSFLTLRVGNDLSTQVSIPITRATITGPTGPTEAIPEPTTMAGLTVFGLGAYLKRRADKSRKQKQA